MKEYKDMTDGELEKQWQIESDIIKEKLERYYMLNNEEYRTEAIESQGRQAEIQKEITKRGVVKNE